MEKHKMCLLSEGYWISGLPRKLFFVCDRRQTSRQITWQYTIAVPIQISYIIIIIISATTTKYSQLLFIFVILVNPFHLFYLIIGLCLYFHNMVISMVVYSSRLNYLHLVYNYVVKIPPSTIDTKTDNSSATLADVLTYQPNQNIRSGVPRLIHCHLIQFRAQLSMNYVHFGTFITVTGGAICFLVTL